MNYKAIYVNSKMEFFKFNVIFTYIFIIYYLSCLYSCSYNFDIHHQTNSEWLITNHKQIKRRNIISGIAQHRKQCWVNIMSHQTGYIQIMSV